MTARLRATNCLFFFMHFANIKQLQLSKKITERMTGAAEQISVMKMFVMLRREKPPHKNSTGSAENNGEGEAVQGERKAKAEAWGGARLTERAN